MCVCVRVCDGLAGKRAAGEAQRMRGLAPVDVDAGRARPRGVRDACVARGHPCGGEAAGAGVDAQELRDTLDTAVNLLPDHEQDAVRQYYFDDASQKEVADDLDVPVSTVKKRLYASRQRMKQACGVRIQCPTSIEVRYHGIVARKRHALLQDNCHNIQTKDFFGLTGRQQ